MCGRFRRGGLTGSQFRLGLLLLLLVDRCEILDRDEDVLFGDNIVLSTTRLAGSR